jgi:hypothetical protein
MCDPLEGVGMVMALRNCEDEIRIRIKQFEMKVWRKSIKYVLLAAFGQIVTEVF